MSETIQCSDRLAEMDDLPELQNLMELSITRLVGQFLDEIHVLASFEIMGLDTQLVEDGTYFVVESEGTIVGCGGWSRRGTMFGSDQTVGRDVRLLDPDLEPARVRAMYTHPDYTRQGIGRRILGLCESAAAAAGFKRVVLVATIAGEPLYTASGYELIKRIDVPTSLGVTVPCARMEKTLNVQDGV